jgi:peptidoglycan/LPS O-acetylase OafA/YrhL
MTSSTRLSYITGLDGIRAIAVMAVLFYHANFPWALGGFLGVETFFVLSGFLITSLLLVEWQSTNQIDLKQFWLRRARRLLPAVWLLLLTLPVMAVFFAPDALPRLKEDIPAAFIYSTNWVYIVREVPYFEAFGRPPLLQQLWSLAVEEQFYILWPLILLFLLRTSKNNRYKLLSAILIMTVLSAAWMAVLYSPDLDPLRVYYGTDTRAAGFLVGAMLALMWSPRQVLRETRSLTPGALGLAGLFALVILYNKLNEFQPFLYRGGILLTALASALLIVGASTPGTFLSKLLEAGPLRWIGSRSYSIYLWHWPVFMLTRPGFDLALPTPWIRIGQVIITFVLAELSYRWIETPVRRRGFRASLHTMQQALRQWSVHQKMGVGAGIVLASILLIWQGTLRQVTASAPLEESPITQNTSLPGPSETPETRPEADHPRPTLDSVTQIPLSSTATPTSLPRATLIGDSIMQGAAPMIEDVLGKDVYVDAARKRKMEDVPTLVETLSQEGHLARVVVIHLGSNRPFEEHVFDDVMEALLAHQVERVIFINVHRPIGWEYYINKKFAEGAVRWPEAELIDWDALAHHEQGWFIRDQTHLSYAGSEAYVNAIQEKLNEGE